MAYLPIQIVDENDNLLRSGTMDEARSEGLWHRIARVIIEDENGRILLQKRGATMASFPLCWDTSAAGHVDENEDYLIAAKREALEETGVELSEFEEIEYYKSNMTYNGQSIRRFNKTFIARVYSDTEFKPDSGEVAELKWFSRDEITELIRDKPDKVTDGLVHVVST